MGAYVCIGMYGHEYRSRRAGCSQSKSRTLRAAAAAAASQPASRPARKDAAGWAAHDGICIKTPLTPALPAIPAVLGRLVCHSSHFFSTRPPCRHPRRQPRCNPFPSVVWHRWQPADLIASLPCRALCPPLPLPSLSCWPTSASSGTGGVWGKRSLPSPCELIASAACLHYFL